MGVGLFYGVCVLVGFGFVVWGGYFVVCLCVLRCYLFEFFLEFNCLFMEWGVS